MKPFNLEDIKKSVEAAMNEEPKIGMTLVSSRKWDQIKKATDEGCPWFRGMGVAISDNIVDWMLHEWEQRKKKP